MSSWGTGNTYRRKKMWDFLYPKTKESNLPTVSQEELERRDREYKRAAWREKIAKRNHYFRFTLEE